MTNVTKISKGTYEIRNQEGAVFTAQRVDVPATNGFPAVRGWNLFDGPHEAVMSGEAWCVDTFRTKAQAVHFVG